MQKTKSSSSTTYRGQRDLHSRKGNPTHRRQGDLLEIHPCVLQDIPDIPVFPVFPDIPVIPDIPGIPVIHDLPAFPGNSTNPISSSISRESTPFQHSPIRMHILHILQFDWFPQKLHRVPVGQLQTFLQTFILQRKGDVAILVKIDIFSRIELSLHCFLSSDNTNCKNDIQLFHQPFDE